MEVEFNVSSEKAWSTYRIYSLMTLQIKTT